MASALTIRATVDSHTPDQWLAITASFRDNNLYQTCEYEACRERETRASVSRIVVTRDARPIGAAQVRIKRIPVLGGGLAYIYRGPLWQTVEASPGDLAIVLETIRDVYVKGQGLTLRIAPNLLAAVCPEAVPEQVVRLGFRFEDVPAADRTILVDLQLETLELRKNLAQKWRNCLNQAERNGLSITRGHDPESWNSFQRLYDAMWVDKQFETGVSVTTFGRLQKALSEDHKMQVLLAWHDGRPVAGHVSSLLGDTCTYLLGASADEGRKTKAAYLLQWQAVEFAKQAGARWYDLGGIDAENNPGVYHFKTGLGGTEADFLGPWRSQPTGATKFILPIAEAAYRRLRPKAGAR